MSRFTEEDRQAVNEILARRDGTGVPSMMQIIERIASGAARAAERALVERIEAVLPSPERFEKQRQHVRRVYSNASERGFLIGSLNVEEALANKVRAALRPEAATTEGPGCKHCGRLIENNMHAEGRQRGLGRCDTADSGLPYGYEAESADEPCSIACRGSSKLAESDAAAPAAVHPDTEGER